LTYHHIVPRAEGGLNFAENFMVLCKPCHDEIEDKGYRSREAIKRHTPYIVEVPMATEIKIDAAEIRKAEKLKAEQAEAVQVSDWAGQWGEGFWRHVPYVKLGQLPPPDPAWYAVVYGGAKLETSRMASDGNPQEKRRESAGSQK
jgi:hypothetical protein